VDWSRYLWTFFFFCGYSVEFLFIFQYFNYIAFLFQTRATWLSLHVLPAQAMLKATATEAKASISFP
jgi:hypothetical protein